jgi:hypothetical protein
MPSLNYDGAPSPVPGKESDSRAELGSSIWFHSRVTAAFGSSCVQSMINNRLFARVQAPVCGKDMCTMKQDAIQQHSLCLPGSELESRFGGICICPYLETNQINSSELYDCIYVDPISQLESTKVREIHILSQPPSPPPSPVHHLQRIYKKRTPIPQIQKLLIRIPRPNRLLPLLIQHPTPPLVLAIASLPKHISHDNRRNTHP